MKNIRKSLVTVVATASLFSAQSVTAATTTWDYNFKTTPDGGAGATTSPIASLTLEDVSGVSVDNSSLDGVKFTLTNLSTSQYDDLETAGDNTFLNGLFLNASASSPFQTQWAEVQLPGGNADMAAVEFGEDEHPNGYDYSIEVNFKRDIPGQNALKQGESISWMFFNHSGGAAPAVSDFLFAGTDNPPPAPDASYPQDVWSTIKVRGVDPTQGEIVFGQETVHIVASPVPLPAAFPLFLSAIIGGLGVARRKASK